MRTKVMNWMIAIALCCALVAVTACGNKAQDDTRAKNDEQAVPTLSRPPAQQLSSFMEIDYEKQASKEIAAENFLKELDALEQEFARSERFPAPGDTVHVNK